MTDQKPMYCTLQTQSKMDTNTAVMQDGEEPAYFCYLLDRVMPWAGGYAVVLEAYLDASGREDGGCLSVAAVAFDSERAKNALQRWENLWGDQRCHMADLHNRKGDFKDWTPEQGAARFIECVSIITGAMSFAAMVSVDLEEVERLAPKSADPKSRDLLGGFRKPYGICCHLAMATLARMITDTEGIAYFFESGDAYQGESQAFIQAIADVSIVSRQIYKRRSHTVIDKADCRLLEISDILAWEWAKHVERTQQGIHMRPSLVALMGDGLQFKGATNIAASTRRGWHVTGAPLERYFGGHAQ